MAVFCGFQGCFLALAQMDRTFFIQSEKKKIYVYLHRPSQKSRAGDWQKSPVHLGQSRFSKHFQQFRWTGVVSRSGQPGPKRRKALELGRKSPVHPWRLPKPLPRPIHSTNSREDNCQWPILKTTLRSCRRKTRRHRHRAHVAHTSQRPRPTVAVTSTRFRGSISTKSRSWQAPG